MLLPIHKMNLARKLCDIELPPATIEKNLRIQYGFEVDGVFRGVSYYNVTDEIKIPLLKRFFGDDYHKYDVTLMIINNQIVPPHTDSGTVTVINIYIETGDAITTFYEKKGTPTEYKLLNQTDGSIYHPDELKQIFSFTAKPFEAWLLDVSKIHSVTMNNPGIRMAYSIMSTESFDTVRADYERIQPIQSLADQTYVSTKYYGYFIVIAIIIIVIMWMIY